MAINPKDLVQRVGAGSIYVAVTAICTLVSWYTTVIVIAATAALCCYEFLRMARSAGYHPYLAIGTVTAGLIPLAFCLLAGTDHVVVAGLLVAFAAAIVMLLRFFAHQRDEIVDVSLTLFGYLYTGLVLSSFIQLRGHLDGIQGGLLGFLVLVSVWANDGFAYLGGSAFGKHKFAPHISPKKSWEGVVCGIAVSIVVWALIPVAVPQVGFGCAWGAFAGLVVGISCVIGDLTESHIKRSFDVKDSGDLMPGHGGLLDRTDSLIFASVVAYAAVACVPYVDQFLGIVL